MTNQQKIEKVEKKIRKWTLKCQYAWTRKEAIKALRKAAKFTRKLAKLQGNLHAYENTNRFFL